jgi:hypothetical protein
MKCFIYRNLHKPGHTYSLKALEGEHKGRVVGYAQCLLVRSASFVVREAGRQRVIQTGRKNVHAGIVGDVVEAYLLETRLSNNIKQGTVYIDIDTPCKTVKYNPYKAPTFYDVKTNEPVRNAGLVGLYGAMVEAYELTALTDHPDLLAEVA